MNEQERLDAKHQMETGGGSGGKLPPRTAVGTGGSGDWEEDIDASALVSWPVPALVFAEASPKCLDGWTSSDRDAEKVQGRRNKMEEALAFLNHKNANIAFVVLSDSAEVKHFIGASLPGSLSDDDESSAATFDALKATLGLLGQNPQFGNEPLLASSIKSMMMKEASHVGCVIGVPSADDEINTFEPKQIELLCGVMHGQNYGLLVLGVPIPISFLCAEDQFLSSAIERAENSKEIAATEILQFVECQKSSQKELHLGEQLGMWQVGMYYFANHRSTFVRLKSVIRSAFAASGAICTPLRMPESKELRLHLEQFGLLRNKVANEVSQGLHMYHFLSPLNSRSLSAYVG
jgi:hypothetical protein